jgi:hypothetical protein
MSRYRDELEAVRARKEALEAEVEALRVQVEEMTYAKQEIADQDAEIDKLTKHLRRAKRALNEAKEEADRAEAAKDDADDESEAGASDVADIDAREDGSVDDERRRRREKRHAKARRAQMGVALVVMGAVGYAFIAASLPPPAPYVPPPVEHYEPPSCKLISDPPGATVYGGLAAAVANGRGVGDVNFAGSKRRALGSTPLSLKRLAGYDVTLELAGYAPTKVTIDAMSMDDVSPCVRQVRLERLP